MSSTGSASGRARSGWGAALSSLPAILLPASVRSFVRGRETGLVFAAILIGTASGILVTLTATIVQALHEGLFGLPHGDRLSGATDLAPWRALVPALGGCALAVLGLVARPLAGRLADAIEANALYGGRLSVRGSLLITLQTILSCGFGASVGLEAGYAQLGAVFASRLGQALAARRADMRLLVACGAAAAIAAAFSAPLAGSFYGFEVVLGTYTVGALAPVAISALVASFITHEWSEGSFLIHPAVTGLTPVDLVHIVLLGILCAMFGIAMMRAVGLSEAAFSKLSIPAWMRPPIGGLAVGGLSLLSPQVLGAGHGALKLDLTAPLVPTAIFAIILLKGSASAISLGSGFRGGLFYASLLLGELTGRLYVDIGTQLVPNHPLDLDLAALTGMAAFGTGVIGAPVAMTALALETTGSFPVALAALIASAVTSVLVRELFGYSFATWRFHLRGEALRGPHDVGWLRDLAVKKLMRTDMKTVPASQSIDRTKKQFPLGALKSLAVLDENNRYAGLVVLDELYMSSEAGGAPVTAVMKQADRVLLPWMTVRDALDTFEAAEADELFVVDHPATRRVVGFLSEQHALRSYGRELERQNPDNVMKVDPLVEPAKRA